MYFGNMSQANLPPLAHAVLGVSPPSPDLKYHLPLQLLPAFGKMVPGVSLISPLKRRHSSCGVCRLKFNSEMQASSHYRGTKHAKRMKALDSVDPKKTPRTPDLVLKDTAQQTQCLQSPCSSDLLDVQTRAGGASGCRNLALPCVRPGNGPATPSSQEGAGSLEKGEGPDATASSPCPSAGLTEPPGGGDGVTALGPGAAVEEAPVMEETESEEEKAMRLLYCSLCKVAVNSASQLQAHNSGTKHKTMLEARTGGGAIKSFPRSGVKSKYAAAAGTGAPAAPLDASTGLQNKTFHCEICDVHVNSETQLKQHISSRRHKDRAAGKPAKPKFSPYPPTPRQHGLQAVRLALRKPESELPKPLSASTCLLHRHLTSAASVAAMVPFHLRPASGPGPAPSSALSSALFQNQQLPQALLHPAATPIGPSAHTPVLFSPF